MALTLPYPSMNFVPLDVLTAAEQNQLVANIEYIANQFPITSQNIDWATVEDISPSDFIALNTGFSFYVAPSGAAHTWVKKFGNLIVASIVVEAASPFTTEAVVIGFLNTSYRPALVWNGDCTVGTTNATKDSGYFYFNGLPTAASPGQVAVSTASSSTLSIMRTKLVYFL